MHRVLPREAAEVIAKTFDWAATPRGNNAVRSDSQVRVAAVVAALEGIPDELLPSGSDRTRFVIALGAMRGALSRWSSGGHDGLSVPLDHLPAADGHPLAVAYTLLKDLPDEAPSTAEPH